LITVLKLGGELLEDAVAVRKAAGAIARLAAGGPVAVVHGGGRAIDAELRRRGLTPRFADGLRITDADTLDAVVTVLAGRTNTQLVAAVGAAGVKAVGLTGADAQLGECALAAPIRTQAGEIVDLGLVGEPAACNVGLLDELLHAGYVPIVASIGITGDGTLLNINADTFAAHLAVTLGAGRLVIAGTTAGVLDQAERTIPVLSLTEIDRMIAAGTAHSGMIAKLVACRHAVSGGVHEVSIVSGRGTNNLDAAEGTRLMADERTKDEGRSTKEEEKSAREHSEIQP
jgi:acetylglutamate kinase